jgi:hypothetical protein
MPLTPQLREDLVTLMINLYPSEPDMIKLVNDLDAARPTGYKGQAWQAIAPSKSTYRNSLRTVVDAADEQIWLSDIVEELTSLFPKRVELNEYLVEIRRGHQSKKSTLDDRYCEMFISAAVNMPLSVSDAIALVEGLGVRLGLNAGGSVWQQIASAELVHESAMRAVVRVAHEDGWLRGLVKEFLDHYPACPEFQIVMAEIDRVRTPGTGANPFDEVLLDADRPFVNRHNLRLQLRNLTAVKGAPVLLVDGRRKTGKSYSFYLIQHVAPTQGYTTHQFEMSSLPRPDELALEIMSRLGAKTAIPTIGQESAERWGQKLAQLIYETIAEQKQPRLFVFDEFDAKTPLPEGTASLIVRLAKYAVQELRPYLRLVLVRFPGKLPLAVDEVTARDAAEPFTTAHMVDVVMKVAKARRGTVSLAVVQEKIEHDLGSKRATLQDRFRYLRELLQTI